MVYPVFESKSIAARCQKDLDQFKQLTKHQSNFSFILYDAEDATFQTMKDAIAPLLSFFDQKLGSAKYVDEISHMESATQQDLWIARTYLFYQLLIYATMTFKSQALYDEVYASVKHDSYRADISSECENFKMGIFGSLTPTSDIDLGIQYSGKTIQTPGLAYVVSAFESLFLIFTGRPSLDFDIETYADMMTIPNLDPTTEQTNPDMFYLDASIFNKEQFMKVLPCAFNSIARNILLAYDKAIPLNNRNLQEINRIFESVTHPVVRFQLSKETLYRDAMTKMDTFLKMDYESARQAYYQKVYAAESSKDALLEDEALRNPDRIADTMFLIGEALSYRMESYTCAPTVIHVVRILQASKNSLLKYETTTPADLCIGRQQLLDPFCSIGYYGFVLSSLEQLGYMYRFHTTYCVEGKGHYDLEKCEKKQKKYKARLENAEMYLTRVQPRNEMTPTMTPLQARRRSSPPSAPLKAPRSPSIKVQGGRRTKKRLQRKRRSTIRKHTK
jgi:hypothetical protein